VTHVLYSEWVPTSKYLRTTLLATAASIVIILVAVTVFIQPSNPGLIVGYEVSTAVLVLMLFIYRVFRGIIIHLTTERLTVTYGLSHESVKVIKVDEIVSCKLVKASFSRFGGLGIRYSFDGAWAYTTSFGNAVEIVPKKGRNFVFSSNNFKKFCEILNKLITGQEN
jgi:hypothetical protein